MRFVIRIILVIVLGYIAGQYLPWQSVAGVAFVVGVLLAKKEKRRIFSKPPPRAWTFFSGFLGVFLLWGVIAFLLDYQNASLLSTKVAAVLMKTPSVSDFAPYSLILTAALMGGFLGGFSMMSGHYLGKALKR